MINCAKFDAYTCSSFRGVKTDTETDRIALYIMDSWIEWLSCESEQVSQVLAAVIAPLLFVSFEPVVINRLFILRARSYLFSCALSSVALQTINVCAFGNCSRCTEHFRIRCCQKSKQQR